MGRRPAASLASIALRRPRPRPEACEALPLETDATAAVPIPETAAPDVSPGGASTGGAPTGSAPTGSPADSNPPANIPPAKTPGPLEVRSTHGSPDGSPDGSANGAAGPLDILAFWKGLRGERRFPSWTDLRFERCAVNWPNSLLLRFPTDPDLTPPLIEASFSDAMRAAALRAGKRTRIDHTPVLTEWLIALSHEAARAGRPISDEQLLPSWRGPARYRAVALPFSEDQAEIDHVLCHVAQA